MFPKKHLCGNKKNALYLEIYPFSPMFFLCEQREEEPWKAADTYTASIGLPSIGCETLPDTILSLIKTDNAQ